jgi:hypothetical protein
MASLIGGIIGLAVATIVFTTVLMPNILTTNTTYRVYTDSVNYTTSGSWSTASSGLWTTVGLIAVVGMLFVVLGVFGVST